MKRRYRTVFKVLDMGGYPFQVLLAVGATNERIIRFLRRKGIELDPTTRACIEHFDAQGRTIHLSNGSQIIRLHEYDGRSFHRACLAHEIFHAVCAVMATVDINYTPSSEEAFAYAIQDLTQKAYICLEGRNGGAT